MKLCPSGTMTYRKDYWIKQVIFGGKIKACSSKLDSKKYHTPVR